MPDPSLAAGVRLQPEVPVMLTWTRCLLLHPPGFICSLYLQTSAMHSCHLLANNSRVPISGEHTSSENPQFGAPELPANFLHRNQKGPQWILQNSENILLGKIPHFKNSFGKKKTPKPKNKQPRSASSMGRSIAPMMFRFVNSFLSISILKTF